MPCRGNFVGYSGLLIQELIHGHHASCQTEPGPVCQVIKIDDNDLVVLCSALAMGLSDNVSSGMDPVGAKRLWLLGFEKLADIRIGKT